jgi:hypothetical protein
LVKLAIGTRGWYGDVAATQSRGIATAALAWIGQSIAVFFGTVVVVVGGGSVVVVVGGSVVVVAPVVVVTGTVVVVTTVVVVGCVVEVVVVGSVVVVVIGAHSFGMVVVVVGDVAGSSWADVVVDIVEMSKKESATERIEQRRSQWFER